MIHDQGLPLFLWAEACSTAVYLQNRSPHRVLGNLTPDEAFSGEKPNMGHLHIFGCLTYSYIPKEKRTKLEPMAEKGIFVGYSETSKVFHIYIPSIRKVILRRDVKFEEQRAFRKSLEFVSKESSVPPRGGEQLQVTGSQDVGPGDEGVTSVTMHTGPSVVTSPSASLGSPLVDSSHGTSAELGSRVATLGIGIGIGTGTRTGTSSLGT